MKLKLHLLLLVLCSTMMFQSCDNDDNPAAISANTRSAFEAKYPSVNRAEWEVKWNYQVAEFHQNGKEMEAWFTNDGQWCMTETDFARNLNQLPTSVQEGFNASQYNLWAIDDIDFYERPDKNFYLIEVEKKGEKDMNLFFTPAGELIKAVADAPNDDVRPDTAI